MQATIIYNANAGGAKHIALEDVQRGLVQLGYEPVYKATDSEDDLAGALAEAQGLVLAVGGDGTIRATALHLLERPGVELAFIPAGTANNISRAFGLELKPAEVLPALADSITLPCDVGRLSGPLGRGHFLEACGCGVYADMLAAYDPEQGKSVLRAARTLLDVLPGYAGYELKLALDGQEVSGQYILAEALNTPMTGPHLNLAPEASPSDGLLDVVLIQASESAGFLQYVRSMRAGELTELPNVVTTRVCRIELEWTGFPLHLDGAAFGEYDGGASASDGKAYGRIVIELLRGALTLRLPRQAAAAGDAAGRFAVDNDAAPAPEVMR